jgi:hypothetical protein
MSLSDFSEAKILNYMFHATAWTPTIYVGLSTADPGEAAVTLAEPSGNGYARVATATGTWTTATAGALENATEITFPTASGSWGTITYVCLFDALTSGNMLGSGSIGSQDITTGIARFAAGALDISLT